MSLSENLRIYAKEYKYLSNHTKDSNIPDILLVAANTIEDLSAKVASQNGIGWIPVEERLPDNSEVLCQDKYGEMMIGYPYKDEESETGFSAESDGCIMYDCIAWQPLPPKYEPKED